MAKTLFDKIWEKHVVEEVRGRPSILYVDKHMVHEVTSPQGFESIISLGRTVRRPDRTFATEDHAIPTKNIYEKFEDPLATIQVEALRRNVSKFGIRANRVGQDGQGIVHVIGPEQGISIPGEILVCGDSHTSTHGAFGTYAFAIGNSEVEMVLTTQCILQDKPKNFQIKIDGNLANGVTAKDVILEIINKNGIGGGIGYVFEYTGSTISSLNMDERMTICNMSIEGGAKAGLVAPDEITFSYIKGRKYAPKGKEWDKRLEYWRSLPSSDDAKYDKYLLLNAQEIQPRVTYGTDPSMSVPITGKIPDPNHIKDEIERFQIQKALRYMKFNPGEKMLGKKIQNVFIGSCTNSRLTDLRNAAKILKGKKIANHVKGIVVPGSMNVRKLAEQEGLAKIFVDAGLEWRYAGCSACLAMNNDKMPSGEYTISTSNRNFENRQGRNAMTILASPITAAASAIAGYLVDVREII